MVQFPRRDYEEIYRARIWAYGDKPDPEFIRALVNVPRGVALDIAGGQGRHALALAALGFDVTLVDSAPAGLHQAGVAAEEKGLSVHLVQADIATYEPVRDVLVVCAGLFFHIPARRTSLKVAKRLGHALPRGGLLYLSLPGYTSETAAFASHLIAAAGLKEKWIVKHLVTKKERPRLSVPRRNETRALGVKA